MIIGTNHPLRALAALLLMLTGLMPATAQDYPAKPMRIVVPYTPGGTTDIVARVLAQHFASTFRQQVTVENRAGASASIGTEYVARSAPDGYTLLFASITANATTAVMEKATLRYNLERDLILITPTAEVPLCVVVAHNFAARDLKELIAMAKAKPAALTYGSTGTGSSQRMGAELFKRLAGVDMVHVPYKGASPALADLAGGQLTMMVQFVPSALQLIKGGKLRALAVTTPQRISMLPDVPTAAEAGLPGLEANSMFGMMAPAGTPQPILQKINAEIARIAHLPAVQEMLLAQGAYPRTTDLAQATVRLKQEIALAAKIIADAKLKSDE